MWAAAAKRHIVPFKRARAKLDRDRIPGLGYGAELFGDAGVVGLGLRVFRREERDADPCISGGAVVRADLRG